METGWLVLLSVVFGVVVGVVFMTVVHIADRRGRHAVAITDQSTPDGIDQVLDALVTAGIVIDMSNVVIKYNHPALVLGLVTEQSITHDRIVDLIDGVRRTGIAVSEDLEIPRGPFGDTLTHLQVQVARLGSRYILVLAEDRTENVRVDDVRRDFIANISHELKTPIGAVTLLAEALELAADDPAQVRKFSARLGSEADRLSRIVREVIELSRLQSASAPQAVEPIGVMHLVDLAVDQNRVAAEAKKITLVRGSDTGLAIEGDETLLVLAMHNLIANAISYSSEGSRVGIGAKSRDGAVEISVTDQGIGIPAEDQTRVFERFFRVDQARARNTGGTGLGLSIVKHVVENHGGDVRVWSQLGSGSTFTIRLPEVATATKAD